MGSAYLLVSTPTWMKRLIESSSNNMYVRALPSTPIEGATLLEWFVIAVLGATCGRHTGVGTSSDLSQTEWDVGRGIEKEVGREGAVDKTVLVSPTTTRPYRQRGGRVCEPKVQFTEGSKINPGGS